MNGERWTLKGDHNHVGFTPALDSTSDPILKLPRLLLLGSEFSKLMVKIDSPIPIVVVMQIHRVTVSKRHHWDPRYSTYYIVDKLWYFGWNGHTSTNLAKWLAFSKHCSRWAFPPLVYCKCSGCDGFPQPHLSETRPNSKSVRVFAAIISIGENEWERESSQNDRI